MLDRPLSPASVSPAQLTPREREVLTLIAAGLSNAEVAARLGVSPVTLRSHVRMAYRRIGVTRRVDAALWAHRHRLVAPPSPLPDPGGTARPSQG